ncbi:LacI family DNA-binding transcriptional regulator [Acidipropionibacterium virtanenii]|uniref:Lactose operon repressor n=1 Tax=Acidipropionibacterium virtanenii TaxID=2057246 RepID=A0A344UQR2_9ACTN|nr:LacI family DNA-binding transcriptional regulator [Acidipropionibacterium virtanenii]AXE37610.1 Lactose operon repressor [Acidipropionibacterium virtanenii]
MNRGGIASRGASQTDVARLAGVSPQTVSRVATGATNVRPATRNRVRRAMEELAYVPNGAARALRYGRHGCIGLVFTDFLRTGEARTAQAVAAAAAERGLDVVLAQIGPGGPRFREEEMEAHYRDLLERTAPLVDGFVVQGIELERPQELAESAAPVVMASSRQGPFSTVGCAQAEGIRAAVEHLLELGHRTVHLISGPEISLQAQDRCQAWRDVLTAHGCPVPAPAAGDWTPASGYRAAEALLSDPGTTAVLAANDEMAAGFMRALHERGLRVPQDVSVVGFDDVAAELLWPRLTTVRQDFEGIGRHLIAELAELMEHRDEPRPAAHVLVSSPLVVRESTAAPGH